MSIPGSASPLFFTAAADAVAAGPIKSVRFNSADSAYLNRTPSSAGNRKTFTFSFWFKKSASSGRLLGLTDTTSTERFEFMFSSDRLYLFAQPTDKSVYSSNGFTTNALLRDFSAWYHVVLAVDTTQSTSANRLRCYLNGVEQTFQTKTYPTLDNEFYWNSTKEHLIGKATSSVHFSGYMADFYFIDGQALGPTSFGAFDDNGVWQAAAYSGSYGTNGFHLFDFANETGIGNDSSGNDNDFTVNNISSTAGAGNDVLFDVPTNSDTSDTGVGGEVSGNYATFNPLNNTTTYTFSNGNLEATGYGSNRQMTSTIGVSSGKWYAEFTLSGSGGSTNTIVGVSGAPDSRFDYYPGQGLNAYGYAAGDGKLYNNGAGATYGATWTYGDVIGVALDLDNGTLTFYKNNSTQGQATTGLSGTYFFAARNSSTSGDKLTANWGQRAFTYTAPSGHKALCTANLPTPTIADGSDYFEAKTFTSNNSSQSITLGLSPDLVWTKSRSLSYEGQIFDAVRGDNQEMSPNATRADRTLANSLTFDSSGFTMGTNNNANYGTGGSSVAWAWDAGSSTASNTDGSITSSVRASQTAGFSIVSYTGTGSSATVGHGLNVAPEMIIIKRRSASASWVVGHQHIAISDPWDYLVNLDGTNDLFDSFAIWADTAPTNSVFKIGTSTSVNANTGTYIAYCFAPVAGYSAFGRYQGNGLSNGVFVYTGFKPAFIIVRRVSADSSNWGIFDSSRDTSNVAKARLYANSSSAESTSDDFADLLSNGFKFRSNNYNWNGSSSNRYIYYAVAENPFQANGGLAR